MLGLLSAGVDAHTQFAAAARPEIDVVPIGVGRGVLVEVVVLIREIGQVVAGVGPGRLGQAPPLFRIEELDERGFVHLGDAVFHRGGDVELAVALPLLGRDQDDAVRSVGAVNGGGGGILEDGDGLDVVRVDEGHRTDGIGGPVDGAGVGSGIDGDAVHDPERLTVGVE